MFNLIGFDISVLSRIIRVPSFKLKHSLLLKRIGLPSMGGVLLVLCSALSFTILGPRTLDPGNITGVSYKWYASVAGIPNLYSVIDG